MDRFIPNRSSSNLNVASYNVALEMKDAENVQEGQSPSKVRSFLFPETTYYLRLLSILKDVISRSFPVATGYEIHCLVAISTTVH